MKKKNIIWREKKYLRRAKSDLTKNVLNGLRHDTWCETWFQSVETNQLKIRRVYTSECLRSRSREFPGCSLLAKGLFTSAAAAQRRHENVQCKFRNAGACRSAEPARPPGAKSAGATPLRSRSPFESLLIYNVDRGPHQPREQTRAPRHYHFWQRRRNSPAVTTASDVRRTCRHSTSASNIYIAPESHWKIFPSYFDYLSCERCRSSYDDF